MKYEFIDGKTVIIGKEHITNICAVEPYNDPANKACGEIYTYISVNTHESTNIFRVVPVRTGFKVMNIYKSGLRVLNFFNKEGLRHCDWGPARIRKDSNDEFPRRSVDYYLNGKPVSKEEWQRNKILYEGSRKSGLDLTF